MLFTPDRLKIFSEMEVCDDCENVSCSHIVYKDDKPCCDTGNHSLCRRTDFEADKKEKWIEANDENLKNIKVE